MEKGPSYDIKLKHGDILEDYASRVFAAERLRRQVNDAFDEREKRPDQHSNSQNFYDSVNRLMYLDRRIAVVYKAKIAPDEHLVKSAAAIDKFASR